jgi:Eco57I restriction-modification methylase/MmeI, target recognition domain
VSVRRAGRPPTDGRRDHLDWLGMMEISGPFLTLPVLTRVWPTLDAVDPATREALRFAHAEAQDDPAGWIEFVLKGLLGWGDALHRDGMAELGLSVPEHDAHIEPSFTLTDPQTGALRLLGMIHSPGGHPTARIIGEAWAATPADRAALLCRHHDVPLGLVTDGRWWALVWAPRGGVTTTAVFDSVTWPEAADRVVVRAFASLLHRRRFLAVPAAEMLPTLLDESLKNQEEVTEALGVQVRRAVEQLVDAVGRHDLRTRESGGRGLDEVATAHDVYRASVSVMMRVVFLLFAEERGLLPADNDLYAAAYSAGRLCDDLERRAQEASEEELEYSTAAWHRLLALFGAVYHGVVHPRLDLPAYDGSIFDPAEHRWLESVMVDDRTVLHMLRSVQYVQIKRERRRLSFRALDVEQIGYVYEGLLSYEGFRAEATMVGLVGKEGLEDEVPLQDLEQIATRTPDVPALAAALAEEYEDSKIGSVTALAKRLAPLAGAARTDALRLLLAATGNDRALAERLLPFFGVLRRDLRDLPVVIRAGSLYVTQSRLRQHTGTHYTPRFLAEQVVDGALEPLVYSPGPLQTADKTQWTPRSSTEILALRVADIAMGSGAFLVAACRYLAGKLVEARATEGDIRAREHITRERPTAVDVEADPVVIQARRDIIERCLYGVDINPMAVEMAKLSLWLVSMDPSRPFTFLDDRLIAGDSLLGITSLDQLEVMHLDAAKGRALHDRAVLDFTTGVRTLITDVADQRRKLAGMPGDDLIELDAKRHVLDQVRDKTDRARLFADLTVGAALAHAGRGERAQRDAAIAAANYARLVNEGASDADQRARDQAARWLATDQPEGGFDRYPLHWPLEFPEVFEHGGFDGIVGNPPFLGGHKITGVAGDAYRAHLVAVVGGGSRGRADMVAYFVLRAHAILSRRGQTGLVATNTLAQGDTREVGLDKILGSGVDLRRAVKSKPWPSRSAALQYCAVWTSCAPLAASALRTLDGSPVGRITAALDAGSRAVGSYHRLSANEGCSFEGSKVDVGLFLVQHALAAAMIQRDPRNRDILMPFLNGKDVGSRPDVSASRWVLNFHDWTRDRASRYRDCFSILESRLPPSQRIGSWWQYARRRPALLRATAHLGRVMVIIHHSKIAMPVFVESGQVFSHALVVFATDDPAMLAVLSSALHYWWAISRGSTLKGDLRYTPTDVFETLALPKMTPDLRVLGERLESYRRELMLARQAGLTQTYNLVHDPSCADADVAGLRSVHREIDEAAVRAYGWRDLLAGGLDHGFHETRQGVRYTVGPVVRQEILDRLLELNHERYAAEQQAKPGAPVEQKGLF